jgi:cyclic pyranopterin monophosphate synthase
MTHSDDKGKIRMVDISNKDTTERIARAKGTVILSSEAYNKVKNADITKGDVLTTAKIAGIQAAKNTPSIIPLCHQIPLSHVDIIYDFEDKNHTITINSIVKCVAKTGAEMEALTVAAVAALTIYDMCKGIDKGIVIKEIGLIEKSGGKSGHYFKG